MRQYFNDYFGNRFVLRFFVWIVGIFFLYVGLAFLLTTGLGVSTYDALWNPLRIAMGVENGQAYYGYVLMVAGFIFTVFAFVVCLFRTKIVRIDYILAIIPVLVGGFLLNWIMSWDFFSQLLQKSIATPWVIVEYPIHILYALIGIPLFTIGIGVSTGTRLMPNVFAIAVYETSKIIKKGFRRTQLLYDLTFVIMGFLILVICVYAKKIDGGVVLTWPSVFHYVGFTTLFIILSQGFIINHSLVYTEMYFGYHGLRAAI